MSLLRRTPFWGVISIILSLIFAFICFYTRNEYIKQKKYNDALCITINQQASLINDLKDEDTTNQNADVLQIEEEKMQEETQVQAQPQETTSANHNDFKSYMPYTTITDKASKQLKLQSLAYTDENGLRCIDGRPMVAVGTGWGVSVGDVVLITCENSNSFEAIVGDIKDNVDTNSDNKTTSANNCRCEFIVDMDELNSHIKISGNVAVLEQYSGYVINVQKIG